MFVIVFLIKAVLTGIIGSSFYVWFKKTRMGVWFNKKVDGVMSRVVKRCDVEVLKKQEKKLKKMPDLILTNLIEYDTMKNRLEQVEKRMLKIETERNEEKLMWHKFRGNPPRA